MKKYSSQSRRGISLQTVKTRKADWIGHVLRMNRILKHITEGKIGAKSGGKTRKQT
jgi:hypothetical protein